MFEIPCWNGHAVRVAFAIDSHDREILAWTTSPRGIGGIAGRDLMLLAVEPRFRTLRTRYPVEWLSGNGSCFTAHETVEGLKGRPIGELCDEHEISQAQYYQCRDQFLANAEKAFEPAGAPQRQGRLERKTRGSRFWSASSPGPPVAACARGHSDLPDSPRPVAGLG